jgi:hypothetical protein
VQNNLSVGGTLVLAGGALVFAPNPLELWLDKLFGLFWIKKAPVESRHLPLAEVAAVGKVKGKVTWKGLGAASGWDRLLITMKNGDEEIFVVSHLDDVIRRISEQLPG